MRPATRPAGHSRPALRAARKFWRLPAAEFERLIALTGEVEQMELKLVVPEPAGVALGADLAGARPRRVYYLDTEDLALERHGIVVRIRSTPRRGDSVIKLRPVTPGELPRGLRRSKRLTVEVDTMPGAFVCSAALKERLRPQEVERAVAGRQPLHTLFTKRQLALFEARAPKGVRIDDLLILGPVKVRKAAVSAGLGRPLAVEQWTYPDGRRMLEISTRCAAADSVPVTSQLADALRDREIEPSRRQLTKTRMTLAYFAGGEA